MSRSYEQISALPAGITPLTGAELCELEQDGESRKFPMSDMAGITAAHEAHHQRDGSDPIGSDDVVAYAIPYLDVNGRIDTRVSDASTTRAGKVMLASDEESDGAKATASNDSRLSDARAPTEHASSHVGGTDPIPQATTSNDGLMTASQVTTLENLDALGSADLGTVLAFEASELGVAYESTDYYTHSKHAIAYGKKTGELLMLQDRRDPVTWAEALSTANPTYPEYFPVVPRYDGNHDITTAQAPLLVAELIDKVITVGSTTTFSGTLASGTITLAATTDNDHLLIALVEAALVLRWYDSGQDADFATLGGLYTGTGQYCLQISGTNYAITGVDAVAREIDIASPPADGAVDFTVPQYGVPGSTTSIRLRQLSGFVPVACGDYDGEIIEGLAKMDRIQDHFHYRNVGEDDEVVIKGSYSQNISVIGGGRQVSILSTTGKAVDDGTHGDPRTGKTTDPRSFGVAFYTWARTLLARDWA